MIVVLALINVLGVKESTSAERRCSRSSTSSPRCCSCSSASCSCFSPADAGRQRRPRRRADVERLPPRDPDRHDRLHGHRDDLEHGRGGARTRRRRSRWRSTACGSRCSRSTSRCRRSRCRRCRSQQRRRRRVLRRCSACPRRRAASPATRSSASSSRSTSGRCRASARSTSACSPRRSSFLATNAGLIGVSRLVYSMGIHRQLPDRLRQLHPQLPHAVDRDPHLLGDRDRGDPAGPGGLPRQPLRVRRDAVVHDRARLAWSRLRAKKPDVPRPYRGPGNVHDPRLRRAAVRGRRRDVHAASRSCVIARALPDGERRPASAGSRSASSSTSSTAAARGSTSTSTHKVAIAQPVVDHEAEYDSVLVHFGDGGYDDQVLATARKLAARKRRGIHVLVTITVPNSMEIDAPMPEQDAARAERHRAGQGRGRRPRVGPRRAGARGPGGAADRRGGGRDARGGDRDAAAAAGRRRVAVRQDARDGAGRAAVPGDHRVGARRPRRRGAASARRAGGRR